MRHLLCLLIFTFSTTVLAEGFAIVVGKSSPIDELNEREVTRIFLAKTTRLHEKENISPHELSNEATQEAFYREISGKSLSQINAYWTTLIFTGKGRPPKKIGALTQLIEVINNNPNSITYLPTNQVTDAMKVVYTVN